MKRVVVSGLGLLTSIGNNTEETWANLNNLKSGIKKISHFERIEPGAETLIEIHS